MKNFSINLIAGALSILLIQSCKKNTSETGDALPAEERIVLYSAPDTANAQPGHYFVTFKESFKMPFAKVYNGSKTVRGAKLAPANAYATQARADMRAAITNPNGSMIVPLSDVDAFVSNVVVGFSAQLTADAVKKLVANPNIEYVEFQNEEMTDADATETNHSAKTFAPLSQTVDPLRQQIGFKNGYAQSLDNTIWIIDGGCDMDHPDLNVYSSWSRSFSNDPSLEDKIGHGTKVAGVLAAIDNNFGTRGVAAGAWIVPIKITNTDGNSATGNFIKALDYIWVKSILNDVVNISQSFTPTKTGVAGLESAIRNFQGWDIWFSIAAGNNRGYAAQRSPARMSAPDYPYAESLGFIYTVSSYGTAYKFSNYFPFSNLGSNYGKAVDIASAGENIYTTTLNGGYTSDPISGTSFAAPIVAGILFLNKGVVYKKLSVTGDRDATPDKVAALTYY